MLLDYLAYHPSHKFEWHLTLLEELHAARNV